MLPNIKFQSAVLKKFLFTEFSIKLATHQTTELVSRMHGFSDYQSLLRGVEKLAKRIFDGKVVHIAASSHYFSGEDEICYFLAQILKLKRQRFFAIEARGHGSDSNGHRVVLRSGVPDHSDTQDWGGFWTEANDLITASDIFEEVMLIDSGTFAQQATVMEAYSSSRPFQAGIISTGEKGTWKKLDFLSTNTDFSPVYHVAISHTYANRTNPQGVIRLLNELENRAPDAPVVAWIFEDDCATGRDRRERDRAILPAGLDDNSRTLEVTTLLEGLGRVDTVNSRFFAPVMNALGRLGIPFIRVPHYTGPRCFVTDRLTPTAVAERDRITADILEQMRLLGMDDVRSGARVRD